MAAMNARRRLAIAVACLFSLAPIADVSSEPPAALDPGAGDARRYAIEGAGALRLQVPGTWRENVKPAKGRMPEVVSLLSESGEGLTISFFPNLEADAHWTAQPTLRALVQKGGHRMLTGAVERRLEIEELKND